MRRKSIGIIGLGPGGIAALRRFCELGLGPEVVCIEMGGSAADRACSIQQQKGCRLLTPCHVISGVGGAAVISGGKISSFPAGRNLSGFLTAPDDVAAALSIALDDLSAIVPIIRSEFTESDIADAATRYARMGFEYRYYDAHRYRPEDFARGVDHAISVAVDAGATVLLRHQVTNVSTSSSEVTITVQSPTGASHDFSVRQVLVAVGRSGSELTRKIGERLHLCTTPGHLDVGVRIEMPDAIADPITCAHGDTKLHFGGARTFCVCRAGSIAPYWTHGGFVLEGCEDPGRPTGLTNLAITVREQGSDHLFYEVLNLTRLQSRGAPVRQQMTDFLSGEQERRASPADRDGSIRYWRWGNPAQCFPPPTSDRIRDAVRFFAAHLLPDSALSYISVYAPEVDYYWQRLLPIDGFQTADARIFVCGDAIGAFRGILQAYCSGREAASQMIKRPYVS